MKGADMASIVCPHGNAALHAGAERGRHAREKHPELRAERLGMERGEKGVG